MVDKNSLKQNIGKNWLQANVKAVIAEAKKPWGNGWSKLTPEMREALVCEKLIYRLLGQITDYITDPAQFKTLWESNLEVIRTTLQSLHPEESPVAVVPTEFVTHVQSLVNWMNAPQGDTMNRAQVEDHLCMVKRDLEKL